MKEGLKKPMRAFALLSLFEIVLTLLIGTLSWAIARHDLSALGLSFYEGVRTDIDCKIVGGLAALIFAVNLGFTLLIAIKGEKLVALGALILTCGIASFFFLPMRFTVFGLGGVIGLAVAYKLMSLVWKGFTWPFRKIFRRAPKSGAPAPPPASKADSP